ncbi:hypothetical protein TcasGA2_TC013926 [Tribolium castaneum]|uniref:Uncharacterized protein n=1 Tax=Tribolium castaneum TaxID=7070 RepID=D6WNB4_TRICA|nr:hypothetical protein TcasGA2_TC013926 [Tribolium castaneum]
MTGPVILCRKTLNSEYFVVKSTPGTNLLNTEEISRNNWDVSSVIPSNTFTALFANGAANLKVAPNILVTNNESVNFNQLDISSNIVTNSNKDEDSVPKRNEPTSLNNSADNEETDLSTSKEPPLTQEVLGTISDKDIKLKDSKLSVEQKYQCLHCLYESSDVCALLKHMRENHVMSDLIFTHWEKGADFEVTPEDVADFIKSCRKVDSLFKCAKCDFESKTQGPTTWKIILIARLSTTLVDGTHVCVVN